MFPAHIANSMHFQLNYRYYPTKPPLPDTASNDGRGEQGMDSDRGYMPLSQVIGDIDEMYPIDVISRRSTVGFLT